MSGRTRDELLAVARTTLGLVARGDAEVIAVEDDSQLTRFANNTIHQNVAESSLQLRVRVVADAKVGVAQLRGETEGSAAHIAAAAEKARVLAGVSHPAPLPPADGEPDTPVAFSQSTKDASPEQRAELAAVVVEAAQRSRVVAYGSMSTTTTRTAIVNSAGLERFAESTQANLTAVIRGDDGVLCGPTLPGLDSIDVHGASSEAVDTCPRNQAATVVEPGSYEVVLSPYAVTDLVEHLSWVGFSALAKQEHRSFMHPGERMMSEAVTIADDPHAGEIFPFRSTTRVCPRGA